MHIHDLVKLYNYTFLCACASKVLNAVLNMVARVLSSTQCANNTMMSTSLMTLPCTQECVIVKFHHIMNMHDQFMGMNTIQQPFLSCLPALYTLAIPKSCYISNVFLLLVCVLFFFVCFGRTSFFVSRMTANIYLRHRHSTTSNLHSAVELSCCSKC